MLIKREQMRFEQTHHRTSSKKIKDQRNKETKEMYSLSQDRWTWENWKESDKAGGWLEETRYCRRCRPPLWAWIITPTFNRAYGTLDNIILQVQGQISFTLFEYIYFFIFIFFF